MVIFGVYIVSKSGGLIFNLDHNVPKVETERVFSYPIDLKLAYEPKKVSVMFGQKDGINGKQHLEYELMLMRESYRSWPRIELNQRNHGEWRHLGGRTRCQDINRGRIQLSADYALRPAADDNERENIFGQHVLSTVCHR